MDKICYYNSNGIKKLTLNEYPYYASESSFRSWEYEYDEVFGVYSNFRRAKRNYSMTVVVVSELLEDRDALCHAFEEDARTGQAGVIEIRGWKLKCFVAQGRHIFRNNPREYVLEFEVVSDNPVWTREKTYSLNSGSSGGADDLNRDYSYNDDILGRQYDYGYSITESNYASIDVDSVDNGYRMLIYGAQENPIVYLNNYPIKVNTTIAENEMLKIVSNESEKTIKILSLSGAERDAFIYRDKENSPFISLGNHTDVAFSDIRFDFTIIERRSDPPWN